MRKFWKLGSCVAMLLLPSTVSASGTIYGTMSNFDVYNETTEPAYGAELELEGIHKEDVMSTYPSHFDSHSTIDYSDGANFGARIVFMGYNFNGQPALVPEPGQSTNGHMCVDLAGCEHFGFALGAAQPTATRYYWLDQNGNRIGSTPMSVPSPTWAFVDPIGGGGGAPVLQAQVAVPAPEFIAQNPDSIWMKIYKTEIERPVDLMELMSDNPIVPDESVEIETEWELLEGGKMKAHEAEVGDGAEAVIRRYEFFEYTGPYDDEHEPTSLFLDQDMLEPPAGELGQFIAANMVAANLVPVANPLVGDFNTDGAVDAADAGMMFATWGDVPLDTATDLNQDQYVDAADAGILFENWTGDTGPVAVPEASSGLLAMFAFAASHLMRRR